jgi:prophage regulatory protein
MASDITSPPHAIASRLLSMAAVLDRVCLSRTQLYRLINAGEFPKPVPVGRQRIAFLEREVTNWIDARVRLRDECAGNETRSQRAIHAVSHRTSRPACSQLNTRIYGVIDRGLTELP